MISRNFFAVLIPVFFFTIILTSLLWGQVFAANINATVKIGLCGDGVVDSSEECDGANLNGASCSSRGFTSGTLSCSSSCEFNTSSCTTVAPSVTPTPSGGGGGGGGGIVALSSSTSVIFSGK